MLKVAEELSKISDQCDMLKGKLVISLRTLDSCAFITACLLGQRSRNVNEKCVLYHNRMQLLEKISLKDYTFKSLYFNDILYFLWY